MVPNDDEPLIRNVSDTARWVAWIRAEESAREDAVFLDPFAERLAGERGREIAKRMGRSEFAFTARTWRFDRMVERCVADGADTVVNLAAGLDARPYRMKLPAELHWIEADLPEILAEESQALAAERPACRLERVEIDLADAVARRALFARIGAASRRTLVLTEGLLIYLPRQQVEQLAHDLATVPSMRWWAVDVASPGLLKILRRHLGPKLPPGVSLQFAPQEGPAFFELFGWRVVETESMLKTAARLRRLSFLLRLLALLPDSNGRPPSRPWGGSCLLERGGQTGRT